MQEIHSIGGTGFFSAAAAGDRRLRPHHHQNSNNNHQALKCPRCDSLNTKFCYYNNYNLSQPRHFCKNCRRYWTKGGVLRNVPVGGGCRKSKRANKTKSSSSATAPEQPELPEPEHKSNSHSSSESSSLTAATAATTEAVSARTLNSDVNNSVVENIHDSKLLISSNCALEADGIFSEMGTFSNLIASTNEALAFGYGNGIPDTSSFQWQNQKVVMNRHEEDLKLTENQGAGSLFDHGVDLSALQSKTGNGEFGPLDWNGGADHEGLFDLPNTVDQAYWSQTHWSDQDNSTLFHLP